MIRRVISGLLNILTELRRSGTTTLIKKIAAENDVWVLVINSEAKKEFGESAITPFEVNKLIGLKPKPILIDNATLMKLSELSLSEFQHLGAAIKQRNNLLLQIKESINRFEKESGEIK